MRGAAEIRHDGKARTKNLDVAGDIHCPRSMLQSQDVDALAIDVRHLLRGRLDLYEQLQGPVLQDDLRILDVLDALPLLLRENPTAQMAAGMFEDALLGFSL